MTWCCFCVALMLRERGVRARFLGADTPIPAVLTAARACSADAVVLAATRCTAFAAHGSSMLRIADDHAALYVAGRGADAQTVAEIDATALPEDPVRAVVFLVARSTGSAVVGDLQPLGARIAGALVGGQPLVALVGGG